MGPQLAARPAQPSLAAAMGHHRSGRLEEAEALYLALLRQQPRNSDAQNLLGLTRFQRQDYPGAIAAIRRAVSLRPEAEYYRNLGMALRAAGRLEQALAAYRQAAVLRPGAPETQFNMGNVLAELDRPAEAAESFRAALQARPAHAPGWQNLGAALLAARQNEAAADALREALRHQPGQPATFYNLGLALERLKRWGEAAAAFGQAETAGGARLETALHLGQCLQEIPDWPAAEAAFRRAVSLVPGSAEAWLGLGVVLQGQEQPGAAAEAFLQAARLRPDWRDAHYNLAGVLQAQGRLEAAEAALRRALALEPDDAGALNNLGNVLTHMGWPDKALELCERARALVPDDPVSRINCARQLLMLGRFGEGWDLTDMRWRAEDPRYDFGLPEWDGRPLPEGRILVWREQGIGDEVMYASLLPELLAAGHRLTLLCEPRLRPTFARCFPGVEFHGSGDPGTALRAQIPIGDLPRLLRRQEADFARAPQPYLHADPLRRAILRARYEDGRPLVGIAWHTSNAKSGHRAVPLAEFGPLLGIPGLRFVSLQYGDPARLAAEASGLPLLVDPRVDALASAEDALAQVAAMDLVVSIDNSTVHFAGALGTRCHVMLPFDAEWRWMTQREDTPWYASLRLLRQRRGEPWGQVIARLTERLQEDAKKISGGTCEACEK
jgi:tetratricopeptide (TPR) repeat protein